MSKQRLEAFSDGVFAILITIMVLELRAPHAATLAALRPLIPTLLAYALSFVYLGIYWNNHHHMFHAVHRVSGGVLWANLHLLFWLSLVPFTTSWVGENAAPLPTALYGVVLFLAGVAFWILQTLLLAHEGPGSTLALALGRDRKSKLSMLLYAVGVGVALIRPWLGDALYVLVALLWLVPDPRIERAVAIAADEDEAASPRRRPRQGHGRPQ
jgi:uncharacterized membrane protein